MLKPTCLHFVTACLLALASLPLQAAVHIELHGLEGEEHEAMAAAVLSGMTLSQYRNRDITRAQVARFSRRVPDEVKQTLIPYGYFDAEVESDIQQQGDDWDITIDVALNQPVIVSNIAIDIAEDVKQLWPLRFAIGRFKPAEGEILNQGEYTESKERIRRNLSAAGYFDAKMTRHRVAVSKQEHTADIDLAFTAGKRYRYGQTHFDGSHLQEGFLERYLPWEPGDYFDQDDLLELQQRLTSADYFSVVNVQPDVENRDDDSVDVEVELRPAKRSVYTGGPFIGTDTGVGIQAGLDRRWVNAKGHKWKHRIVLAQRLKMLNTLYTVPIASDRHRAWNFGANYRDADTKTSQEKTLELIGNQTFMYHDWLITAGMHALRGTFTVGARRSSDRNLPGVEHGRSTLVYPEITAVRKHARNPDFVRHGWALTLTARSTVGTILSDTRFSQMIADAKWITSPSRNNRLILRAKVGLTNARDFSMLHPQLRFFDGGTNSNRGYAYQALGPRNSDDRVIGGRRLIATGTTFEHYFTRNWGMATFVDAGNAFNGTDFKPEYAAGLGLRWRSPVGMLRVDLGKPIHSKRHHGVQFNLSIGPDL